MRVGLVAPFFLPQIGGANRYCFELAKSLSDKGLEIHLFSVPGAMSDAAYQLHPILTLNLFDDIRALRRYEMDVWHVLFFYYAPLALVASNVFVTAHGDDGFSQQIRFGFPGKRALERTVSWRLPERIRRNVDKVLTAIEWVWNYACSFISLLFVRRIVTVSRFTQARLGRRFPFSRNRISVVPPGVGERFFCVKATQSAPPLFLTVARADEADRIKNIHSVILALSEIKDNYSFEYIIVAGSDEGSYRKELESLIYDKDLGSKVSLQLRVNDRVLAQLYRRASLFILVPYAEANNFEGFGIVFLEANASGVPVLTSREGGMTDYVVEGRNGFYVKAPTPEGIKEALVDYLEGRVWFDRSSILTFPENFRWPHIAERILKLYESYGALPMRNANAVRAGTSSDPTIAQSVKSE